VATVSVMTFTYLVVLFECLLLYDVIYFIYAACLISNKQSKKKKEKRSSRQNIRRPASDEGREHNIRCIGNWQVCDHSTIRFKSSCNEYGLVGLYTL